MKTAAIFPGQGSQAVGMGADVAAASTAARELFAHADEILGFSLSTLCFEGPAERLNATDIQQPAIFATSVAFFRAAEERGHCKRDWFAAMGGLSLGEYTALHLAGSLRFDDALRLVFRRGQLMQAAAEANPGGMVTVLGLDEAQSVALCERVATEGRLSPANFNCPGQIVLSGDRAACEAAARLAGEFGGKAIPLRVAGAFHSPLMAPAADQFRTALETARIEPPGLPVIANVDVQYHGDAQSIRRRLLAQVTEPVRWQGCVQKLIADGFSRFIEIGPGRVLSGLLKKTDRSATAVNLGTVADLEALATLT